jgi:hypothetical protein
MLMITLVYSKRVSVRNNLLHSVLLIELVGTFAELRSICKKD